MNDHNGAPIGTELGQDIFVGPLVGKPRSINTYCIRVHPTMSTRLNIGPRRPCILTAHRRDCDPIEGLVTSEHIEKDKSLEICRGLSATTPDWTADLPRSRARIRVIATVLEDEKLDTNRVEIDETLRTCLGIQMDLRGLEVTKAYEIRVSSVPGSRTEWLTRLFGHRHIYARIGVGFIADIDKPVGRIPAFAFPLLGVPDGGRVICEVALRNKQNDRYLPGKIPLNIFSVSAEIQEERRTKENDSKQRRFRSSADLLGLDNELPRIFVGHDLRRELNSGDLDVVRLRRSIWHVLTNDAVNFGIVAFAAFAAFVIPAFTYIKDPYIDVLSIVAAVIVAGLLIIFRLRSHVT